MPTSVRLIGNPSLICCIILENINFPITLLLIIKLFPKLIRDFLYNIFANNRYLFGKRNQCFIPEDHKPQI